MKKIILTIFILGCFSSLTFAQSACLDKGENGWSFNGGISTSDNFTGFNGGFSYSLSGVLDLGLSMDRLNFDQTSLGTDLNATIISPYISYLIVKQDDSTPVSFGLDGSYQRQIYSNSLLNDNNIDMRGDYFTIGASLFTDFRTSESMKIQPEIGAYYITGKTGIKDSSGNSNSQKEDTTGLNIGLSLIFETSSENLFVVTPSLGVRSSTATYGLSLNFMIPQN